MAVDGAGQVVAELGDSTTAILPRSSLKPFQAIASLRAGARLTGESLAIAAGSHHASPAHLAAVRHTLADAGLPESALRCTPSLPQDPASHRQALIDGAEPRSIWHNCSGKHAGMLAACVASGWDPATYLDAAHPYQVLVREVVVEKMGEIEHTATDGCGAPVHAIALRDLAAGYARLPWADAEGVAVAEAMSAHPVMVGGVGQDDTRLMELLPGTVAKLGAEGVLGISAPGVGGVAVKVSDGAVRPAMMVGLHLLQALGVDTSPAAALGSVPVLGHGLPVGTVAPSLELLQAVQAVQGA